MRRSAKAASADGEAVDERPKTASRRLAGTLLGLAAALVLAVSASGATARSSSGPPTGATLAALAQPGTPSSLASDRIYFVLPDRYANGYPSNDQGGLSGGVDQTGYDPTSTAWWHGGDLKGLTGTCTDPVHGLERIKDLGFNAIWVTPPVVNQITYGGTGGYHGYWGVNFTKVDPHLGSDQDFGNFVDCAHSLGLKVIMDVVVNHTGNVIQLEGGSAYIPGPYRDCHGKQFDPAKYVGKNTFPCMSAQNMPKIPFFFDAADKTAKTPAWLNDPTNYHDRGDIDFSSCSELCIEQGDLASLDDLFTEKPAVEKGLAQIYSAWIEKYKLDGFRVDTARHLNPGFWKLWVPQMDAAAKSVGVKDFQIFGEVAVNDDLYDSTFVRDDGLPSELDFPFQDSLAGYASGQSSALAVGDRLNDDDYFRTPAGADPAQVTFLGNHDMGRAAYEIQTHGFGLTGNALLQHVLLGYDLLYLLRGAPVVLYGDEVGMIGSGGDQAAREDMFPTQVKLWQTEPRVGSPAIGTGSSFDVTNNPIQARLEQLAELRTQVPALSTGASIVRYAKHAVLAVSRIDADAKQEYLVLANNGEAAARITVPTSTPSSAWTALFGTVTGLTSDAAGKVTVTVPADGALLLQAAKPFGVARARKPKLAVRADELGNFWDVVATVPGTAPVTISFAVQRAGGAWKRLDVDDSAPYRAFLDPARFKKNELVKLVAIVRALNGSTATSAVVSFRVRGR